MILDSESVKEKVDELYFVFQPIVYTQAAGQHKIDSYEVLLRSQGENIFPSSIFKDVLANNRCAELLFEQYTKMVHDFMERIQDVGLSINLRYQQLAHKTTWDFLTTVQNYKHRITIEFTEVIPENDIGDTQFIRQGLERVKEMGYQIAIDDVGTGMNSKQFVEDHIDLLSWIKLSLLPFQLLERQELLSTIKEWQELADSHSLRLIVEAVEEAEWAADLRKMGVNFQQGFLWGKGKLL